MTGDSHDYKQVSDFLDKYPQFKDYLQMPTKAGELKLLSQWGGCSAAEVVKTFGAYNVCIALKDLESIIKTLGK